MDYFNSGGLEMLFADQRQHALKLPSHDQNGQPVNIAYLIDYLCQNVMQDSRKELFVLDNNLYVSNFHARCAAFCVGAVTPFHLSSEHDFGSMHTPFR